MYLRHQSYTLYCCNVCILVFLHVFGYSMLLRCMLKFKRLACGSDDVIHYNIKCFWLKNSETQPNLSSKPSAFKRLLLLKHQEDSLCSREMLSSILVAKTMNLHLCSWCLCPKERRRMSQVACSSFITYVINFVDLKSYTKVDCAFHYWAKQNRKVLSQLAWIVFAVTMTQVSAPQGAISCVVGAILWFTRFGGRFRFPGGRFLQVKTYSNVSLIPKNNSCYFGIKAFDARSTP